MFQLAKIVMAELVVDMLILQDKVRSVISRSYLLHYLLVDKDAIVAFDVR